MLSKRISTTVDHINRTAFVSPVSAMTSTNIVFADPRGAFFSCG